MNIWTSIKRFFIKKQVEASDEPMIKIVSSGIDKNGKVKIEFEWNSHFIQHLRDHGFTAATEDELVQLYLASLVSPQQLAIMEEDNR